VLKKRAAQLSIWRRAREERRRFGEDWDGGRREDEMAIDKRPNVLAAAPTTGVPMPKRARFLAGIVSYVVLLVGARLAAPGCKTQEHGCPQEDLRRAAVKRLDGLAQD